MKKIIVIIAIFILLINIKDNNTETVFNELIEYSNLYEITFTNNISTNNFLDYFSNTKVIWIKPKMNILYQSKLTKFNKYYFKESTNIKNINKFKDEYIKYIDKLGYKNETLKIKASGIMLEKIKVYLTKEELNNIKTILTDIKIENVG